MDLRHGWPTATFRAAEKQNKNKPCLSLKMLRNMLVLGFRDSDLSIQTKTVSGLILDALLRR